jgi:hypothetical protein
VYYVRSIGVVGYEWTALTLAGLRDIEPQEVMQALGAARRWPRTAMSPDGIRALTLWSRTKDGRPLIVVLRHLQELDWLIVGARDPDPAELAEFVEWEAGHAR